MKKIILVNGVIAGVIISGIMLLSIQFIDDGTLDFDRGMLVGYAAMVLGFSMIFVGIKTYRDQVLQGVITFWQGCKAGLLIALVASLIYAISWDVYYNLAAKDFTAKYTEHYLQKMNSDGASEEEISSKRTEMESFNKLYENFFIRFGVTLMEILPVGVIVTVLSAAILRKREAYSAGP